jgi:hypothetical protein
MDNEAEVGQKSSQGIRARIQVSYLDRPLLISAELEQSSENSFKTPMMQELNTVKSNFTRKQG